MIILVFLFNVKKELSTYIQYIEVNKHFIADYYYIFI